MRNRHTRARLLDKARCPFRVSRRSLRHEPLEDRLMLDAHGNDPGSATPVIVPSTTAGEINYEGDADYFSFSAEAGVLYDISTTLDQGGDSELRLFGSDGITELATNDSDGEGSASRIGFIASVDGTYFIEVIEDGNGRLFTYTLGIDVTTDDHGDDSNSATPIAVPSLNVGDVQYEGDTDFFSFDATAGDIFRLALDIQTYPSFTLYDTDGISPITTVSEFYAPAEFGFLAPASGTYFIGVNATGDQRLGAYELEIETQVDDHGNDAGSATPIALTATQNGIVQFTGDADWFSFDASAGETYDILGTELSSGSMTVAVYDSDGATLLGSSTRGGPRNDPRVALFVSTDATFFVAVTNRDDLTSYALDVQVAEDDHGCAPSEATSIEVPSNTAGRIDYYGDEDLFSFTATAGTIYDVVGDRGLDLTVYGTNGWSVLARGDAVGRFTDFETSRLSFIAPVDGTVYLEVTLGNNSVSADYTVSVREVVDDHGHDAHSATPIDVPSTTAGHLQYVDDADYFSFDAIAGTLYNIFTLPGVFGDDILDDSRLTIFDTDGTTELGTDNFRGFGSSARIGFSAPTDGTYFIAVTDDTFHIRGIPLGTYTLSIEVVADTHGNDADSATPIAVPSTTAGEIIFANDADFYSFNAIEGTDYNIFTTLGSLRSSVRNGDAELTVFDTDGTTILETGLLGSGPVRGSRIRWEALTTGTYYISVADSGDFGTYQLWLAVDGDDHGNDAATASPVSLGTIVPGEMSDENDVDYFSFTANQGELYRLAYEIVADENDIGVLTVFDTDGTTTLFSRSAVAVSRSTTIGWVLWRAPVDGTYFATIDQGMGSYEFAIDEVPVSSVAVPSLTPGATDKRFGNAVFSFVANAGVHYTIESSRLLVQDGLQQSTTNLFVYDTDATTPLVSEMNRSTSSVSFVPEVSGVYYLEVREFSDIDFGTFDVEVTANFSRFRCDYVAPVGCDAADLDALYDGSNGAPTALTDEHIAEWLDQASDPDNPLKPNVATEFVLGDVDLDGNVTSRDLGMLLNNFGDTTGRGWGSGNFSSDDAIDSRDLGSLLNNMGFTSPEAVAATAASADLAYAEFESDGEDEEEDHLSRFRVFRNDGSWH